MNNAERKKSELERDRRNIARMYLSGTTQMEIASELGLSQSTVSRDLSYLQKEWAEARISDIDERKRMELAKIDILELEYWDAWRGSKRDSETETKTIRGDQSDEKPKRIEQAKRIESQNGDPRYLVGVQWCIERRCGLLGLDAPKRTDVTSGNQPIRLFWPGMDKPDAED